MEGDSDPVGVRGWLLFFVLALALFSPLMALAGMVTVLTDPEVAFSFGEAWPAVLTMEWALFAASVAGLWFLAWRLVYVRNPATVRIVVAGIWIVAVGGLFAEFALIAAIAGIPIGLMIPEAGTEIVRPFVFCTIWTLYLLRSRRVDNTYRRSPDRVAEVFG